MTSSCLSSYKNFAGLVLAYQTPFSPVGHQGNEQIRIWRLKERSWIKTLKLYKNVSPIRCDFACSWPLKTKLPSPPRKLSFNDASISKWSNLSSTVFVILAVFWDHGFSISFLCFKLSESQKFRSVAILSS